MFSSILLVKQCSESSSSAESSSSDDELILGFYNSREKHVKITHYFKSIIPRYSNPDFKSHFRFSRVSVEEILIEFHLDPITSCVGRPPVQPAEAFLMTLWVMANQECFRSIADRFGFSKGHAHTIFMQTLKKICMFKSRYICWPEGDKLRRTIQDFNNLRSRNNSFPNVVGAVDGTHIPIPGPKGDDSFYNRKGFHSIHAQGICNSKMEFIDVYCGWPGSVHDARVWRNSPIYEKLNNDILPGDFHLLGDTAYPLDNFTMVPFKDNGHLSRQEKKFNKSLSSIRVVIEQAFGRLKGMWRTLKYLNVTKLSNVKYIIIGACILHNIGIEKNIDYEPSDTEEEEDEEIALVENIPIIANAKRNHIMRILH